MKEIREQTEKIIQILTERHQTITFAESCTGGRIAAEFTAVSGASNVLHGSAVTYSNEIKHRWLGVDKDILDHFGAVSRECVSQMLKGIVQMADADYAVAVSGIAGPTGGTELKPVGTVYIGIKGPSGTNIHHCLFDGGREQVQQQSVSFAVKKLAKILNI